MLSKIIEVVTGREAHRRDPAFPPAVHAAGGLSRVGTSRPPSEIIDLITQAGTVPCMTSRNSGPDTVSRKDSRQPRLSQNAEEALWMGALGLVLLAALGALAAFFVTQF